MKNISSSGARKNWSTLLGRVEHRGRRFGIIRNGRAVAALVPHADVELLNQREDEIDVLEAREAIAAQRGAKRVDWAAVKAISGIES
jgi:antitoxin (DNA-binding transcriptional repressor) of toxin-antitoxin stability system